MHFDPAELPPQECYQLLVGGIVPRPIAWVSTLSASGVKNLAPYSFFTVASCNPPVLCVTQVNPRDRAAKDTLENLSATRECVVNIVSADLAEVMNATCANYPPHVSEFEVVGIEEKPSRKVAPPGVKAAKVRYECRLRDIIEIVPGASGGTMMLLDVVDIYVNDGAVEGGRIDPAALDAIGRLGGDYYAGTRECFALERPMLKGG